MDTIPTYAEWDELAVPAKKEILVNLRRHFDDKDIREYWNLPIKEWYRIITRYKLNSGEVPENVDLSVDDRKHRRDREPPAHVVEAQANANKKVCSIPGCGKKHVAKGFCQYHYVKSKKQERKVGANPPDPQPPIRESVPSDRDWPRSKVVEAEYVVIDEAAATTPPPEVSYTYTANYTTANPGTTGTYITYTPATTGPTPQTIALPFPAIKGTTAQLRKQFEGVALFLEGNESEETRFVITLTVQKA